MGVTTSAGPKWVMPHTFDSMIRRCDVRSPVSADSAPKPPLLGDVRGIPAAPPLNSVPAAPPLSSMPPPLSSMPPPASAPLVNPHVDPQDAAIAEQVIAAAKAGQWV